MATSRYEVKISFRTGCFTGFYFVTVNCTGEGIKSYDESYSRARNSWRSVTTRRSEIASDAVDRISRYRSIIKQLIS